MDIKVNGRTLSDRPLVLGVQGDNNVEELRFLVPRYTDAGVDLSLGIGYAVFRLPDGTDGHVSLTPEVLDTDENTVSLTLLVGAQMTEQKGSGKLCLKVAGLESAMWSSTICDMFVNGTITMPSPQPVSLFRTMSIGPRLAEEESEPPLTVTERTINIPAELQTIAVAQDENSEAVKIVVPRYFDGQDLSVHDFILHTEMGSNGTDDILFNNQNGQMKAVEDSTVTLTWVLRPPQTSFEGKLNIQLLVQGDEFKWHSLIGELDIAKHITGDPVVPATPSMYEQWLAEVKEQADYVRSQAANIQQVVDNLEDIQNAAENAQAAAESAEAAQKAAQEALGFRTFFSAVRPDANGNLDPSRPMTVGPAASVEIESAGDRIQSVTAHGFTQQAGTGDPSPTNVRALTNGGLKLVEQTFDGGEDEGWQIDSRATTGASGSKVFYKNLSYHVPDTATSANAGVAFFGYLKNVQQAYVYNGNAGDNVAGVVESGSAQIGRVFIRIAGISTVPALQTYLTQNPIPAWIQPASETDATGLYAPVILTSGEYRATCLPLTAPLCEGDTVQTWAKSGCDKVVTFDGSEGENWETYQNCFVIRNVFVNSVPMDSRVKNENIYTDILYQSPQVSGFQQAVGTFSASRSSALGNFLIVNLNGDTDISAFKAALAAHPLTVWYRSTNYTEADDIPVSLETHQRAVLVLDGMETLSAQGSGAGGYNYDIAVLPPAKVGTTNVLKCSHYKSSASEANSVFVTGTGTLRFTGIEYNSASGFRSYLAAQYAAGTPVTIVYQLATPITYAHEAVVLVAATGDQLTYTVTGQSGGTVSVALKPFQDGGHAKTAENATNAITAQTAANAQQLGGLTLSALQNLIAPIGYIFSWAPVDDGPDLSTPAKVAEYFGFGTWAAYGTGQVLVGVDSSQTEFATVGQTGGEKTHTLTTQELPKFTPNPAGGGSWMCVAGASGAITQGLAQPGTAWAGENVGPVGGQTIGGNQPHNNLQPYITVYRWQRVA